jgi:hypothetical protein
MFKVLWLLHSAMGNGGQKGSEAPRVVNATPPLPFGGGNTEMATGNGEQEEGSGIFGENSTTEGSAETFPATATNEIQPSLASNEGAQPSTNETQPFPATDEGETSLSTNGGQPSNAANNGLQPATNEGQQPATNERQPSFSTNQGQEPHNSNHTVSVPKVPPLPTSQMPTSLIPPLRVPHGCNSQAPLKYRL